MSSIRDPRHLLPQDKGDLESVHFLSTYSYEELKPILPELLEWLQDYNWPVARPIATLLKRFFPQILPDLIPVLESHDAIWKYWILQIFFDDADHETVLPKQILSILQRMVENPTSQEKEEELNLLADKILTQCTIPHT
jgi:uncharacterized protein YejL (UPF0352 family)